MAQFTLTFVWLLPDSETEQSEPVYRAQQLSAASSASNNTLLKIHTPAPELGGPLQRRTGTEAGLDRQEDEWVAECKPNCQLFFGFPTIKWQGGVFLLLFLSFIVCLNLQSLSLSVFLWFMTFCCDASFQSVRYLIRLSVTASQKQTSLAQETEHIKKGRHHQQVKVCKEFIIRNETHFS